MEGRPSIGLIVMRADWFGRSVASSLLETIESDTQEMVNRLAGHFHVKGPWVVDSLEALQICQHALREADLDLVLMAFQTWSEDTSLVSLLQAIGSRPLILWCYQPWRRAPRPTPFNEVQRGSGAVGTFAALGMLRNLGVSFQFTFGSPDDPRLIHDLKVAGRAAQVRRGLRAARFGLLPSRNEQMQVNFVDEFRLMSELGPVVQSLSVSEFSRVVHSLSRVRVEAYLAQVRQRFEVQDVSDETLLRAAQAALGLAHLAVEYRLDVLSLNESSVELQRAFNMRPGLYPDLLEPLPVLFQPEGDLGAATANYILHHLTGSPTMFLEIWFWDEARNQIIAGHAGLQNPLLAEANTAWISQDFEFQHSDASEGAQFQFVARPGRVTVFQVRSTPKGWQAIALSGVCLEGRPWVQGYPHVILRLDTMIDHFLNRLSAIGASQHWIMAYGSVIEELEAFCEMANIPLEVLSY